MNKKIQRTRLFEENKTNNQLLYEGRRINAVSIGI